MWRGIRARGRRRRGISLEVCLFFFLSFFVLFLQVCLGGLLTDVEYQGMRRVREVLETHQWGAAESDAKSDDGDADDADELERELLGLDDEAGFDWEVGELEREMVGLRFAMERGEEFEGDDQGEGDGDGDDERRVESVEGLLLRMQAIRGM